MKKKVLNTDINKLNWRFNQIFFSDHKPGQLLYDMIEMTQDSREAERAYLMKIMECIQFLGKQGIALQGNSNRRR